MKYNIIKKDNADVVIIDEFYTDDELSHVRQEVKDIYKFRKGPGETGDAMYGFTNQKTGTGVFLYDLYYNWKDSAILKYNKKLFAGEYLDELIGYSIHYKHIKRSTADGVLVNYYNHDEIYDHHTDESIFTVLILLELGEFSGGHLQFKEIDEQVEFKDNRAVIFPGCLTHKAMPVYGTGTRVSIAQFINYAPS